MEEDYKELIEALYDKLYSTEAGLNFIRNDFYREERKGFVNGLHYAIFEIQRFSEKKSATTSPEKET
jgi:hypothetical protein